MNVGLKNNIKIAEKYCLAPEGCPKLKGKTDYNEKLAICAGCTNYLNKIDLVELLQHYYTSSPTTTKPPTPTTGKGTELSKADIKKILTLYHIECIPITRIAQDYGFSFRTVKNVVNQSFKNPTSNKKVEEILKEMNVPK